MERRSVPLPPHAFGTAATKMPRSGMVQASVQERRLYLSPRS